ncbi:MAG: hypothetical protein ABWX96_05005 [Propionibacteriaceae bacterium]
MTPDAAVGSTTAPLRGAGRLLRLGVLGGVSLLLAAGAHTAGGGALPAPGVLVVAAGLLGLMALVVTQRRCRFPLLLVVLGAQQAALHAVFAAATGPAAACAGLAGSAHHGAVVASGCTSVADAAAAPMVMPGPGMWLAHTVAVVATAWLLSRAEAWLWRTADRIIRTATAAPTSIRGGLPSVRGRFARLAAYASPVASPAAPRGPPGCGTV